MDRYHPVITVDNDILSSSEPQLHIYSQLKYIPELMPRYFDGDIRAPWSIEIEAKINQMIASAKVLSDDIVNDKVIVKEDADQVQMDDERSGEPSADKKVDVKPNLQKVEQAENADVQMDEEGNKDVKKEPLPLLEEQENKDVPMKKEKFVDAFGLIIDEKKEGPEQSLVPISENKFEDSFSPIVKVDEKENDKGNEKVQRTAVIKWMKPDGTVTELEFSNNSTGSMQKPADVVVAEKTAAGPVNCDKKLPDMVAEKSQDANAAWLQIVNASEVSNGKGSTDDANGNFADFQSVENKGNSGKNVPNVPSEMAQDVKGEKKKSRFKRFRQRVGRVFRRVFRRGDKGKKHMKLDEEDSVDERKEEEFDLSALMAELDREYEQQQEQ